MMRRQLLGGLLMLVLSAQAAIAAPWLSYEEPDFKLYGDASRRQVADVIQAMQLYRYARDAVLPNLRRSDAIRPRILVLSGLTFAKYAFVRKNAAGFVSATGFSVDIVVDGSASDWTGTSSIIQHELTHYYLHQSADFALPVWYDEGFAEYLSTVDTAGGKLRIGFPAAARGVDLLSLPWMPLREMFMVNRQSTAYTNHQGARVFYAQSWLLIHYILSVGGADARAVGEMIGQLDRGVPLDAAIDVAFGNGFQAFEERVRQYARRAKFRVLQLDAPQLPDLRTRIVEIAEARGEDELLMFGMRSTARSKDPDMQALAARLSQDASNGRAAAAQALVLRSGGDWQQGLDALERCSRLTDDDAGLVLCGDAWMTPVLQGRADPAESGASTRAAALRAAELYDRAWRLNPQNFEAINSLAGVFRYHKQGGDDVQRGLQAALERLPRSSALRLQLADFQAGAGDLESARQTLERLLTDSIDPTWRLRAIRRLREVENQIAAKPQKPH
jgi:tetratricopeptide (TPR) repeat protein